MSLLGSALGVRAEGDSARELNELRAELLQTKRAAAESAAEARVLREQLREREESSAPQQSPQPSATATPSDAAAASMWGVPSILGMAMAGAPPTPPRAVASSWRSQARGGARHAATDVDTVDPFLGLRDRIEDIFNNEITRSASFKKHMMAEQHATAGGGGGGGSGGGGGGGSGATSVLPPGADPVALIEEERMRLRAEREAVHERRFSEPLREHPSDFGASSTTTTTQSSASPTACITCRQGSSIAVPHAIRRASPSRWQSPVRLAQPARRDFRVTQ